MMHIMLTGQFMEYLGDMFMREILLHLLEMQIHLKEELWEYRLT